LWLWYCDNVSARKTIVLICHTKVWFGCESLKLIAVQLIRQASASLPTDVQIAQWKVRMEKVNYLGQPNSYRLSNGTVEVVVSTDVGPRILRYGFLGKENVLGETLI